MERIGREKERQRGVCLTNEPRDADDLVHGVHALTFAVNDEAWVASYTLVISLLCSLCLYPVNEQ